MQISSQILISLLSKKDINVNVLCDEEINVNFEMESMLNQIRNVIINEENNDYMCVERIIEVFESYGIDCGVRHD